ncbi:unnamed protein product [Diamesa hyperborea]
MRFHQPVGVIQQNNFFVNNITNSNNSNNNNNNNNNINNGNHQESPRSISDIRTNNQLSRVNVTTNETIFDCHGNETNDNVTENVATRNCLNNLHAIIKNTTTNNNTNNTNNFDNFNNSTISGNTTSGTTVFGNIVKTKNESKYFNNYFGNQQQHQQTTTNNTIQHNNNNNDNENRTLLVGTLDLTEENLTKFITSSTTYDNCVTNQSYNEQNSLSTIQQQRRGNLIKLDLESNYMTKYEGPFQGVDNNSAGCSTESSPVDSLLDDQELVSPAPSSCADLSSPDQQDLQQRNYPRGIINPNYPGFQHLAHTLAEHFVDHHHFEPSSDSDLSEDFDFDVAFRVRNLDNVNIMNDNNNNDNINIHNNSNAMEFDKNIDLNQHNKKPQNGNFNENVVTMVECLAKECDADNRNCASAEATDEKRDYQPDLIKNITETISTNGSFNLNPPADTDKCNLSLSLESSSSTVDIIGDFGKEIEKEIGLIVSGYMTNATADIKSSQKSIHSSKAQSSLGAISKMGDAVLSSVEEKIIVNKDSVESSDRFEAVLKAIDIESSLIPTAIVKPKYQKLAFDERQLPIIGSTDDDSSWFNNSSGNTPSSTTTTITTTPRKVQKHLPNFDRRSQKSFSTKHTRKLVDYTVSDKEAINSLRHSEKDIDCSVSNSCNFNNQVSNSVAIVQPLKKNDMNTNCFDKHLDHSQLNVDSKNSSMSDKHEQNLLRNNSKINNQNITSLNSLHDYGNNNNLNIDSKSLDVKYIFDVYNIETALPVIDLEAIETHLMAAKEEEQKRKNDREAIRRRLAMGEEDDYFTNLAAVRPIRKPNLQSRMQNGKNLQICFMNEAASDTESSDSETCPKLSQGDSYKNRKKSLRKQKIKRPTTLSLGPPLSDNNFFTHQARLQIEARMALAQAKDMAHMQMEMERQKQRMSPITELVHKTLDKVGMKIPEDKRRMSRQMLTVMNVAQLQIIVNELHTYIETLNEALVKYLMDRDDLHMKQDSMLIDIEDITRYLVEKEEANTTTTATSTSTTTSAANTINGNNNKISQSQQLRHIDPKTALAKRTTRISPSTSITSLSSKKSLVVNGNGGGSVITSISKERNEQQRLHL